MSDTPVRNETLRLTLSGHERLYIDQGLARAVRTSKRIALLLSICTGAVLVSIFAFDGRGYLVWLVVLASVVGFVSALKLLFALIDVFKFRSYRNDHEKFLKHYRRGT